MAGEITIESSAPKVLYCVINAAETTKPIQFPMMFVQITFVNCPKPFITESRKIETAYQGKANAAALKTRENSKLLPNILLFQNPAK